MYSIRKLKEAVKSGVVKRYQPIDRKFSGFLGRTDGTVRITGRDNYVYVTLWDGSVVEAFNNAVPATPGLPVTVLYRSRRYRIEGINSARDVFTEPVFVLPDGIETALQWPNSNTLFVRGEQFMPGLVMPIGGMVVRIFPTDEYLGEDLDMTSHIPATGARWALIEVNDTAAHVVDGSIVALATLNSQPKPSRSAGYVQKAAVRLYAGQTSLLYTATGSDVVDKRFDSISDVLSGDITHSVVIKSVSYTMTAIDEVVVFTATCTGTLPAATGTGTTYRIVCRAGNLSLLPTGSDTIKGAASQTLYAGEDFIITDTASGVWE